MLDLAQNMTVDRLAVNMPGERTAVVSWGGTLSYSEFDTAVDHMAEVLRAMGIERDDGVAVIVPRSLELVVAIHGILRAGGAYVPIDPEYPALRIRTILEDSGARVLVAGTEYGGLADELGVGRVEPSLSGADSRRSGRLPRRLGLRHIYVGIDRPTEGRGDRAPVAGEPTTLDAAAVSTRPE